MLRMHIYIYFFFRGGEGGAISFERLNEISSPKTKFYSCQNEFNEVTPTTNFIVDCWG